MSNLDIQSNLNQVLTGLGLTPTQALGIGTLTIIIAVLALSWLSYLVTQRVLVKFLRVVCAKSRHNHVRLLTEHNVFRQVALFIPGIVVYVSVSVIHATLYAFTANLILFIKTLVIIYLIFITFLLLNSLLSYIEDLYNTLKIAKRHPIKSYLQVIKIVLFLVAGIIIISIALNKSPLAFLTGLGAITAIISFIFKDSITGFVSSIQLTINDVVRIGDWIEIPNYGVDGDVIEMSLSTVKVSNFDKTIVSVPSHALLSSGVKNWRGIQIAGARRIKRCLYIDLHTIRFCTDADIAHFNQVPLLINYLKNKLDEIKAEAKTTQVPPPHPTLGQRQLTNIGTFRAYILNYLTRHPQIRQDMTCMVRQLDPTEHGLPIEIYAFVNTTQWSEYENIQADIFDHLLAIANTFDLRVFQTFSNAKQLNPNIS